MKTQDTEREKHARTPFLKPATIHPKRTPEIAASPTSTSGVSTVPPSLASYKTWGQNTQRKLTYRVSYRERSGCSTHLSTCSHPEKRTHTYRCLPSSSLLQVIIYKTRPRKSSSSKEAPPLLQPPLARRSIQAVTSTPNIKKKKQRDSVGPQKSGSVGGDASAHVGTPHHSTTRPQPDSNFARPFRTALQHRQIERFSLTSSVRTPLASHVHHP